MYGFDDVLQAAAAMRKSDGLCGSDWSAAQGLQDATRMQNKRSGMAAVAADAVEFDAVAVGAVAVEAVAVDAAMVVDVAVVVVAWMHLGFELGPPHESLGSVWTPFLLEILEVEVPRLCHLQNPVVSWHAPQINLRSMALKGGNATC